jgi:CheY-like chemotaxis protein
MPVMNGWQCLKILKEDLRLSVTMNLTLTSSKDKEATVWNELFDVEVRIMAKKKTGVTFKTKPVRWHNIRFAIWCR